MASSSPDSRSGLPKTNVDAEDLWGAGERLIERVENWPIGVGDANRYFDELVVGLRSVSGASVTTIARTTSDASGHRSITELGRSGVAIAAAKTNALPDPHDFGWSTNQDVGTECCRSVQKLAGDDVVFIHQEFADPVPPDVRQPISDLQVALTHLSVPVLLRQDLDVWMNRHRTVESQAVEIEKLFAGRTPIDSYHQIASVIARISGAPRATLIGLRGNKPRVLGSSLSRAVDQDARTVRSLAKLVDDATAQTQYMDAFAVEELRVVNVSGRDGQSLGHIVLERFEDDGEKLSESCKRLEASLPIVSRAIELAIERDDRSASLPRKIYSGLTAKKLAVGALLVTAMMLGLCLIPVPFSIAVDGKVEAVGFASVFATDQGIVAEAFVRDGERVEQGVPLLRLASPSLDLVEQETESRLATAQTKLSSMMVSKRDSRTLRSAETEVLKSEIDGFQKQLAVIARQRDRLLVRSPIAGVIDQWDASESFIGRPVSHGHHLMDMVNEDLGYRVRLSVPDQEIGYLTDSRNEPAVSSNCTLRMLSSPTITHTGTIVEIATTSRMNPLGESVVDVIVEVDDASTGQFRRGAGVIARVSCEDQSIAFVMFRGFVQWWRTQAWI